MFGLFSSNKKKCKLTKRMKRHQMQFTFYEQKVVVTIKTLRIQNNRKKNYSLFYN